MPKQASAAARKGRGRPPIGEGYKGTSPRLSVAVTPETLLAVSAAAEREGVSKAAWARGVIDDAVARDASALLDRTRTARGLPPTIEDPAVLRRVAAAMRTVSEPPG